MCASCAVTALGPVLDHQHQLDGADLEVKPYFDFLQPKGSVTSQNSANGNQDLTEINSEHMNDIQMQSSPPISAAASSPSSSQPIPKPLAAQAVDEIMESQTEDAKTLTSHVSIADPIKLALFQRSPLQVKFAKTDPDFSIQVKEDGVHIVGTGRKRLEQIQRTISDVFSNMSEAQFTLEPEKVQLLAREDVKARLQQTMGQTGSPTLYSASNSKVVVTSLSQSSAEQACSFLKSQLCHFNMTLDMQYECMLYCREWSEFLQTLGFTSVKVSDRGGNIDVFTLEGMENEKQSAIMQFLTTPIERETVISMEPGMLKYIQIHCHQLLADMDQVSIFPLEGDDLCGLKVRSAHVLDCTGSSLVLSHLLSHLCHLYIYLLDPRSCSCLPNG